MVIFYLDFGKKIMQASMLLCKALFNNASNAIMTIFSCGPRLYFDSILPTILVICCRCMEIGNCAMKGWPKFAYDVSKIGVTVMTQIQQKEMDRTGADDIIVNAVSVISVVAIDLKVNACLMF
jgi:hypothetical protein